MKQTMQQMLDALMARAGNGEGKGGNGGVGGGPGGGGQDGYSVSGNSAAIPAYGPNRLQFSRSELSASNGGNATGRGKGTGGNSETASNTVKASSFRDGSAGAIVPENIPAKYRDAVKRYFTQPEPTQ